MNFSPHILDEIKGLAQNLGFVATGYANITPLTEEIRRYTQSMDEGYFAELNYLKRNIEKRENPQLLVEGAKSVLVFLAPYGSLRKTQVNKEDTCRDFIEINCLTADDAEIISKYKVAQYSLGEDYHTVIKAKLNTILSHMQQMDQTISGRVFVDTAPVLERAWAVEAGLGFIGKNNFFISREHGIRNFIGVIISNFEIQQKELNITLPQDLEDSRKKKYCGNCTKCLEACPTGALCAPYTLDARKCTSYLTIENKEASMPLNLEMAQHRDGWIFGCDACMNACPWNSRNKEGWTEFQQKQDPLPISHLKRR